MLFAWLPTSLKIPERYSCVFTWPCVVCAWLPIGLNIPERHFIYFHEALRRICMACNRSGDS